VRDGFDVALDEVGESLEYAARSFTEVVAHAGKAASAALTARSASTELARATSANFHVQSSGERSSKVREEAMRSPLM